jgi:hypothetical protein
MADTFKLSPGQLNVYMQEYLAEEEFAISEYRAAKANWNNHYKAMHGKPVQPRPTPPLKFHLDAYGKVTYGPEYACEEVPEPELPPQLPVKSLEQVMAEARANPKASLDPNKEFVSLSIKLGEIWNKLLEIEQAIKNLQ